MTSFLSKRPPDYSMKPLLGYTQAKDQPEQRALYLDAEEEVIWMRRHDSVKTPNFKRLPKKALPVNPFYGYTFILRDSLGTIVHKTTGFRYTGAGRKTMGLCWNAIQGFDQGRQPMSDSIAINKALGRMSDLKFNAAQAFAERRQTANLVITTVNRLVTFAVLFRKGDFRRANEVLRGRKGLFGGKNHYLPERRKSASGHLDSNLRFTRDKFANAWLELSYGWRPLIGDIHGACELLADTYEIERPSWVKANASSEWTEVIHRYGEGLTATATVEVSHKTHVEWAFDIEDDARNFLRKTGIGNPALLAWELLPYSFVLDWIYPVGKYLEHVNAAQGLRFLKGSKSRLSKWSGEATAQTDGTVWSQCSGFMTGVRGVQLHREVLSGFPPAPIPRVSLGLDLKQVTSGLSLLTQIFNRR